MTLALKWGEDNTEEGGFIYFDATTLYTQNYRGQVTKHPIDAGGTITDHFIKENPVFTISAVITGSDISTNTYLIQDLDGNAPFNSQTAPNAVSVNSTNQSVLSKLIPASIGQFLPDTSPEVVMDGARADLLEQIRDALINLVSGVKYNDKTGQFDSNIQILKIYEFEQILLKRILNNIVMTNITFREDANTGYALYCDMTFEQVTFAYLKKTVIPKDVVTSLQKKAASKESKGKQDSTVKDTASGNADAPKDTDPLKKVAAEI